MPPSRAPSLSFTPAAGGNEDRAPDVMGDLPFLHTPHPSPVMGPVVARPALSDPPFLPSSIEDLLKPAALALLTAWLAAASTEWRACASGAQDRFRTPPLTLHQSDMVPGARGVVWDLRDPRGPPVPLSTSSRASRQPILRADRILTFVELHHYPDRALPQELAEGWRGHSDSTPLLTVLALPNAAFVANMASAIPSVRKDVENNLASLFPTHRGLPFLPGRCLPMGSVAKSRSDERRLTINGSYPHAAQWVDRSDRAPHPSSLSLLAPPLLPSESEGFALVSPNANTPSELLAPVRLPGSAQIAQAHAILALSGVQVMGMKTDDSAAYKQTLIHPSEQWKQLVFWEGDRVLVPHVLGFGGCEGPSDYQRLSCLKHHIIVDMLATSLGCSPLPAPSGWQGTIRYSAPDMNTCRALFPEEGVSAYIDLRLRKFPHSPLQWLPLWVGIYLDDHNSLTLGPHVASWLFDTMVRAADHFGWILSMKKWFAEGTPSTSKILLGVQYDFVSLTKSIPEDKVLFATKQIRGILRANGLFMSDLFSCLMRLLNLSVCIPYMRLFLNEGFILLRLAKKGVGISRSGWISLSAPFSHDLRWMIKGILANPGVPISRAVAPLPSAQWHTDASGRFSGGWMWSDSSETEVLLFKAIPWSREERRWCDINVLEALGLLFAATAFGPFLRGRVVRANTDNLNVAFALEKQKSHSALASVLAKLFHVCAEFAIEIDCHWVERALNHVADDLSKDHLSSALSSLGSPKHRILEIPEKIRNASAPAIRTAKAFATARGSSFTPGVLRTPI